MGCRTGCTSETGRLGGYWVGVYERATGRARGLYSLKMEGGKRYAATTMLLNEKEFRDIKKINEKMCWAWPYDEEFCTSLEKERKDVGEEEEVECKRLKDDGEEEVSSAIKGYEFFRGIFACHGNRSADRSAVPGKMTSSIS